MADPLYSAASELAPVQAPTNYFDPGAALGIAQRYGMSATNRAFAEDALASSNAIDKAANFDPANRAYQMDRMQQERKIWDREDADYAEKKEFESSLGTFLVDMAALKDDPQGPEKAAQMLADPRAAQDPSVKAMFNVLDDHWGAARQQQAQQDAFQQRMDAEISTSLGVDPATLRKEDGSTDWGKVAEAAKRAERSKLDQKTLIQRRTEEIDVIGKEDNALTDMQYKEQLDQVVNDRAASLFEAAKSQNLGLLTDPDKLPGLLEKAPGMSKEAFVSQVLDLGKALDMPDGLSEENQALFILNAKAELPPELRTMVDVVESVWDAAYIRSRRPNAPAPASKKSDKPNPNVDQFFD